VIASTVEIAVTLTTVSARTASTALIAATVNFAIPAKSTRIPAVALLVPPAVAREAHRLRTVTNSARMIAVTATTTASAKRTVALVLTAPGTARRMVVT